MSSNKVLFEYSLAFELWAMKRCFLLPLMKLAQHGTDQLWHWMWGTQWISSLFIDTLLVQTAPSQVSGVMKERVLQRSVELSWQEPEHPNGVITEYEIKYYEKVSGRELRCEQRLMPSWALSGSAGHFTTIWGHSKIHVYHLLCLITTPTTSASWLQSRSLFSSLLCHTSERIGSIFIFSFLIW